MTYGVGVKLEDGLIFASDSRSHAGVDNYASLCKMTVFNGTVERVLVLLSSGGLAATQTVINLLRKRMAGEPPHRISAACIRCSTWPIWCPTRCATPNGARDPSSKQAG